MKHKAGLVVKKLYLMTSIIVGSFFTGYFASPWLESYHVFVESMLTRASNRILSLETWGSIAFNKISSSINQINLNAIDEQFMAGALFGLTTFLIGLTVISLVKSGVHFVKRVFLNKSRNNVSVSVSVSKNESIAIPEFSVEEETKVEPVSEIINESREQVSFKLNKVIHDEKNIFELEEKVSFENEVAEPISSPAQVVQQFVIKVPEKVVFINKPTDKSSVTDLEHLVSVSQSFNAKKKRLIVANFKSSSKGMFARYFAGELEFEDLINTGFIKGADFVAHSEELFDLHNLNMDKFLEDAQKHYDEIIIYTPLPERQNWEAYFSESSLAIQ